MFYVRIDKNRKIPVTVFIRCLGLGTDQQILDFFGDDDRMRATIEKDTCKTMEEALFELYRKLRPSEPPTIESAQAPHQRPVLRPPPVRPVPGGPL